MAKGVPDRRRIVTRRLHPMLSDDPRAGDPYAQFDATTWSVLAGRLRSGQHVGARELADAIEANGIGAMPADVQAHVVKALRSEVTEKRGPPAAGSAVERGPVAAELAKHRPRRRRIPAQEIENLVVDGVSWLLRSPRQLVEATRLDRISSAALTTLREAAASLADDIAADPARAHRLVRSIVDRVTIAEDQIRIAIPRTALTTAVARTGAASSNPDGDHTLIIPAKLRSRGVELRFILHTETRQPSPDPSLIRAVLRGHNWFRRMMAPERPTMTEIATADGVSHHYVRRLLNLAFLAPEVVKAILDGRQPADLTAERISRAELPLDWHGQKRALDLI